MATSMKKRFGGIKTRSLSIPFRRETEIGETPLGAAHGKNLPHLVVGQLEIENLDIFRQPLDPRGARDRGDVLLHQPAQADLRRALL